MRWAAKEVHDIKAENGEESDFVEASLMPKMLKFEMKRMEYLHLKKLGYSTCRFKTKFQRMTQRGQVCNAKEQKGMKQVDRVVKLGSGFKYSPRS